VFTYFAVYVNVSHVLPEDIDDYVGHVTRALTSGQDPSERYFFIPAHNGSTRIEILNPPTILVDDTEILREYVERLRKLTDLLERKLED